MCLAVQACTSAPVTSTPVVATAGGRVHVRAKDDPTVHGARLVPETFDLAAATVDASGAARGIVQGVRFVSRVRGSVMTADERIDDPQSTLTLPARLGGGVLFVNGDTIYRADDWLAHPKAIFRSLRGIDGVFAGLDRVYVRTNVGAHIGMDPRTGAPLDLGPWPSDPSIGAFVALDGWRAVALTNVRGVVGTSDAGRTWEALDVPIRGRSAIAVRRDAERDAWVEVAPGGTALAVVVGDVPLPKAPHDARKPRAPVPSAHCYLVSDALSVSPLASCDEVVVDAPHGESVANGESSLLRAAVVDGWPLQDGSALLAAEGDLMRVSLADGTVRETIPSALDRRLAHCHAVALGRNDAPSAFGFVCGAPAGATTLFAYDDDVGRLRELHTFATPRRAQTGANGSWLVEGACGASASTSGATATYCVGTLSSGDAMPGGLVPPLTYAWRDVRVEDLRGAALAVTADGRVAQVDAPGTADAHLYLTSAAGTREVVALRTGEATPQTRRLLAHAMWQGGLEERPRGVYSGWLAAEGTVVGVQVDESGDVRIGAYVRDLGSPFVAGRYGLGWTRSQTGYETTDGGMTWASFRAPLALAPSRLRSCGPAGCVSDGWLRIGWGVRAHDTPPLPNPFPQPRNHPPAALSLTCRAAEPVPVRALRRRTTPAGHANLQAPFVLFGQPIPWLSVGSLALPPTVSRTEPWFHPPSVSHAETLVQVDTFRAFDGGPRLGPLGRVYAWGPTAGDWSGVGRWVARWRSPFGGLSAVASSATVPSPFRDIDGARADMVSHVGSGAWTTAIAEDSSHALLIARFPNRPAEITAVDEGGALAPLLRVDGEPWGAIDSVLRIGSEWFVASPEDSEHERVAIFRNDAAGARQIASVQRHLVGPAFGPVRLARGGGGGGDGPSLLGVVIDGEPAFDRSISRRWVIPVDVESGKLEAPEPLGAVDLSDRTEVPVCADDSDAGWVIEAPWPNANVTVDLGAASESVALRQVYARTRLSSDRACVERLAADIGDETFDAVLASQQVTSPIERITDASPILLPVVLVADAPFALRCAPAPSTERAPASQTARTTLHRTQRPPVGQRK